MVYCTDEEIGEGMTGNPFYCNPPSTSIDLDDWDYDYEWDEGAAATAGTALLTIILLWIGLPVIVCICICICICACSKTCCFAEKQQAPVMMMQAMPPGQPAGMDQQQMQQVPVKAK